MKTLDYFYNEILSPICIGGVEAVIEFAEHIAGLLLTVILFVTVPIWIIPYIIIRNKKEKNNG